MAPGPSQSKEGNDVITRVLHPERQGSQPSDLEKVLRRLALESALLERSRSLHMASSTCLMLPDCRAQRCRTGFSLVSEVSDPELEFLEWTFLESRAPQNGCSPPTVPRPAAPHLPRPHIAAEGVCVAATSHVQFTFIDGYADTAVSTPALVACAVVGAQGPRDTLSLWEPQINESGLQGSGQRAEGKGAPLPTPESGLQGRDNETDIL